MNAIRHLTESERQNAADGRMPVAADRAAEIAEHLARCSACAEDVGRINRLMAHLRAAPTPIDRGDDLWPEIRSRIEREKVIPLPASDDTHAPGRETRRRRVVWAVAGVAAILLLGLFVSERRGKSPVPNPAVVSANGSNEAALAAVADSVRTYEREATFLLNELELRRAMLRPATRASIDHDLRVIDQAIAELKDAIANDPNNPALRRLLAYSYRQKVDLLKRVGNAG